MSNDVNELKEIIKAKDKVIAEMNRDMDGTLMEMEKLRARIKELEEKGV